MKSWTIMKPLMAFFMKWLKCLGFQQFLAKSRNMFSDLDAYLHQKESRRKEVAQEHQLILEAIKAGDVVKAVTLNDAHLERSLDVILRELF